MSIFAYCIAREETMIASKKILLFLLMLSLFSVSNLSAKEEYAAATGRDCAVCHLDPAGGGELTAAGEGYALSLGTGTATSTAAKPSAVSHWFRFLVGYLHILFGIFWFGTILYVHLILKPGYASRGLPRGEVKLGLVSILVMGITGAILFAYRVPDLSMLVETRFGMLLLLKIILYLVMVGTALVAVFVIGPRLRSKRAAAKVSGAGDLSLEELLQFDGKEGRAGYIAYKGIIYDVSNSLKWKNGVHMGRHLAGGDLTDQLGQAPHGEAQVLAMPEVGKLRAAEPVGLTPPQKLFYAMAYMNLGFVLLIILILTCWKWL
jgi:predicted heme/steroid binding protein/uncharacterized membrane protein